MINLKKSKKKMTNNKAEQILPKFTQTRASYHGNTIREPKAALIFLIINIFFIQKNI